MSGDLTMHEKNLQELTLPLHRDLGRIEGRIAAMEGRIGSVEARVLRNESITEEGFRIAEEKGEKRSAVIETKLESIEKAIERIVIKQASNEGKSTGGRSTLWTVGSVCFAAATLIAEFAQLLLRH